MFYLVEHLYSKNFKFLIMSKCSNDIFFSFLDKKIAEKTLLKLNKKRK